MFYTIVIVVTVLCLLYIWLKNKYSYWERRNVKGPMPIPFLGNIATFFFFMHSFTEFTKRIYRQYPNEPVVGIYLGLNPGLVLRDTELIKSVLIKDFNTFPNRGVKFSEENFAQNLFSTEDDHWRVLRQKLTPIFTSGKLKNMIPLVTRCVNDFIDYVDQLVEKNQDHEIRELASKYTLEAIGACAFGVDMKTFTNERNPFRETAIKMFSVSYSGSLKKVLKIFIPCAARFLNKYFKVELRDKKLESFFIQLVNDIISEREGKVKVRKDFMDLLIELKEQGKAIRRDENQSAEIEIDVNLIAAQASSFYGAGFETSAATMSFLMYELALNPDIQDRAANEVKQVANKHIGALTYEAIKDMPYLNACLEEALRKYPVGGLLFRKSNDRYTFPGTKITIDKGTRVFIPINALQSDEQYFKEPAVFRPERFLWNSRNDFPHCAYMPFGEGPRNCIGLQFAKVQSLMGVAAFLQKFTVEPSSKTRVPLTFVRRALTLTADGGIWLKINRRNYRSSEIN